MSLKLHSQYERCYIKSLIHGNIYMLYSLYIYTSPTGITTTSKLLAKYLLTVLLYSFHIRQEWRTVSHDFHHQNFDLVNRGLTNKTWKTKKLGPLIIVKIFKLYHMDSCCARILTDSPLWQLCKHHPLINAVWFGFDLEFFKLKTEEQTVESQVVLIVFCLLLLPWHFLHVPIMSAMEREALWVSKPKHWSSRGVSLPLFIYCILTHLPPLYFPSLPVYPLNYILFKLRFILLCFVHLPLSFSVSLQPSVSRWLWTWWSPDSGPLQHR